MLFRSREPGEPKPKCMSNEKRKQLTKKERAAAVAAKRRNDPVADRSGKGGKPVNVSNYGKGKISEEYLEEKNVPTNPSLWSKAKSLARSKFDVYPCVPLDSKAITKEGLKTYDELSLGEEILTYNINNDVLEWKPITYLHFYENAALKKIYKPTGFCLRATENHKWVVKTGENYNKISLVETKNIHKRMRLITCSSLENNNEVILEKWSKKDNWVSNVLSWPKSMREVFLASSIIYDGHDVGGSTKIKDRHTFGFTQKNDDHFWAAVLSAYLNGYHVSFHEKTESISGASIIRNKKFHSTQNLIIEDDVSEDVWCPTTDNETWVMVQNGFITITGNSAYANGWAAKWYKNRGGGWKSVNEEYIEEASFSDRRVMEKHLSSNNFVSKGGTKHERWEHPSGEVIYLPREKTFADGIVYKTLKAVKKAQGTINEKIMTEPHSKDKNKSASRFDASDELVDIYTRDTPGQTKRKRKITEVIKRVIHDKLNEIAVRDASGHKTNVKNVPIRMADGTIKKLPPGKSGSSGGGGNGSESGITEAKTPAWQRKEGKDPKGGLNKKGVASYRAANPGSKLQTAVTTEPSKLKPGSKKAKRRLSFCARSGGQMKMWPKAAKDPNSRLRKARRKWNC